jgi:hypothetical protein
LIDGLGKEFKKGMMMKVRVVDRPQPTLEELQWLADNPDPRCQRMNELHPLTDTAQGSHTDATNEVGSLRGSIVHFGLRQPRIFGLARTGRIIDGLNTLRIWLKVNDAQGGNLERPKIEWLEFENVAAEDEFLKLQQLARRNLSKGQRAQLSIKVFQRESGAPGAPSIDSQRKNSGVSRRTQMRAGRVSRQATPALEEMVGLGKVSSKDAEVLVATKSKREQAELVAQGPEAVKAAAKAVRAAKAAKDQAAKDALVAAMAGAPATDDEIKAGIALTHTGKHNVEAALDQVAAERGVDRHAAVASMVEPPTAFDQKMATPVAPRAKGAPAASAGPGIADLQMELRLYWKGATLAEQVALLRGLEGVADAAFVADTTAGKRRLVVGRWDEISGLKGEAAGGNGAAPDKMALVEQSAKVKRKTRDADTLRLCEMIEGRA